VNWDRDDFRRRAAVVRQLSLESVLVVRDATRDERDRSKWHTEQGPLSVNGPKFINWQCGVGGGGAIDLVMHLAAIDFRAAVAWLEENLTVGPVPAVATRTDSSIDKLCLPVPDDRMLGRVLQYLTDRRHLPAALLAPLVESGKLYADRRGNAVFLLVAGKANRPVGAELRGTGPRVWRGMAPGSRKDSGYFWIGTPASRSIVLCESAIDAISCSAIDPHRVCISTSGVRANPAWIEPLIARGYHINCGFDADEPGDNAANQMIALHPAVQRLRPPAHDWNDALAEQR
jgi:hypothetical protein